MSHQTPENLKYSKEHEWAKIEGDIMTIGITDFAQSSLGDIVFMELPDIDSTFSKGDSFGVVESIKSVSDLYSPVSGTVVEAHTDLADTPELCNSAPYDSWMIKIKMDNPSEAEELLNSKDYESFCADSE